MWSIVFSRLKSTESNDGTTRPDYVANEDRQK